MHRCAALILAAGSSSRLGSPKQLLPVAGQSLLAHVTDIALESQADLVVVVLGAFSKKCAEAVVGSPVRIIENKNWSEGIASSIRAGVASVRDEADAVLILLCDQPMISRAHLDRLMTAHAPIAASAYGGSIGSPVFFERKFFDELLELHGDQGAKPLLAEHAAEVTALDFPDGEFDIDEVRDYERFCKSTVAASHEMQG